ncbi:MAG: ARMT1-like domain-containing protein [Desulfobacterales bacterium]
MKTYLDCIPCFIRQALDAVRLATSDKITHERVLRGVMDAAGRMDFNQSPPVMGQQIHRIVRKLSRNEDPYKHVKDRFNRNALDLYPQYKKMIEQSTMPLEAAVRLAIAGNIIDLGPSSEIDQSGIDEAIGYAWSGRLQGNMGLLEEAARSAENILYLGDNSGEIVFDRLLIEHLPVDKVTFAVRGSPVINDATMADAEKTGMTGLVKVIDNGSDAPGTIIEECSEVFRRQFNKADLVISKGQGNYETLSDVAKDIFFILKAKCPVIAQHIGCNLGSLVILSRLKEA